MFDQRIVVTLLLVPLTFVLIRLLKNLGLRTYVTVASFILVCFWGWVFIIDFALSHKTLVICWIFGYCP